MTARKIDLPVKEIAELCRRYRVRELSVFGSFLGEDFRPDSDIDLLVESAPMPRSGSLPWPGWVVNCPEYCTAPLYRKQQGKSSEKSFLLYQRPAVNT
jgi:hypothetical protein